MNRVSSQVMRNCNQIAIFIQLFMPLHALQVCLSRSVTFIDIQIMFSNSPCWSIKVIEFFTSFLNSSCYFHADWQKTWAKIQMFSGNPIVIPVARQQLESFVDTIARSYQGMILFDI